MDATGKYIVGDTGNIVYVPRGGEWEMDCAIADDWERQGEWESEMEERLAEATNDAQRVALTAILRQDYKTRMARLEAEKAKWANTTARLWND